jgi:hypothetical protein
VTFAVPAAVIIVALAAAGPVAAFTEVSRVGAVGPYSITDTFESPDSTCLFRAEDSTHHAWFKGMKVQPPTVFAADRVSELRDHRKVSWQFKIQARDLNAADSKYKAVASSAIQRGTAYEDAAAPFSPMKMSYDARNLPFTSTSAYVIRTLLIIKWYKPGGGVEGSVKAVSTYYRYNSPFGIRTATDYCVARDSAA